MKKNLLEQETLTSITERVKLLKPNVPALWGQMNANQMLRHLSDGMRLSYGEIMPAKRGNFFSRQLMRFFILHSDIPTPKGKADTFEELNMVERGINPENFEEERAQLLKLIQDFPNRATSDESPLLGQMSKANWARLNYTHLHHHLSQFGV